VKKLLKDPVSLFLLLFGIFWIIFGIYYGFKDGLWEGLWGLMPILFGAICIWLSFRSSNIKEK